MSETPKSAETGGEKTVLVLPAQFVLDAMTQVGLREIEEFLAGTETDDA